jgi:hypothetical protein
MKKYRASELSYGDNIVGGIISMGLGEADVYLASDVDSYRNTSCDIIAANGRELTRMVARINELELQLQQSKLERDAVVERLAELTQRDGIGFLFLWMTTPNPMMGNLVPLERMKMGRGKQIAQFIEQAMEDEAAAQKARSLMERSS